MINNFLSNSSSNNILLKEIGINDITVVIAYKQELYFFLQDKWGVNLEINPDLKKNNIYSLYIVRNYLKNTYILNANAPIPIKILIIFF